jgi:hypothetical protein
MAAHQRKLRHMPVDGLDRRRRQVSATQIALTASAPTPAAQQTLVSFAAHISSSRQIGDGPPGNGRATPLIGNLPGAKPHGLRYADELHHSPIGRPARASMASRSNRCRSDAGQLLHAIDGTFRQHHGFAASVGGSVLAAVHSRRACCILRTSRERRSGAAIALFHSAGIQQRRKRLRPNSLGDDVDKCWRCESLTGGLVTPSAHRKLKARGSPMLEERVPGAMTYYSCEVCAYMWARLESGGGPWIEVKAR